MKRVPIVLATFVFTGAAPLFACPQCRPLVKASVYNADFAMNLSLLLLPLALLGALGFALHHSDAMLAKLRREEG